MKTYLKIFMFVIFLNFTVQGTTYDCPCVEDTCIFAGDYNDGLAWENRGWGTSGDLFVGDNTVTLSYRSLLRFPLSEEIGSTTSITGAILQLTISNTGKVSSELDHFPLRVFVIDPRNSDWQESGDGKGMTGVGGVCWNACQRNRKPWYGEEGIGTNAPGVLAEVGSVVIQHGVFNGDRLNIPLTTNGLAYVKEWMQGKKNAGFLLASDERLEGQNAVAVCSRHAANESARPHLLLQGSDKDVSVEASESEFLLGSPCGKNPEVKYADYNYGISKRIGCGVNMKSKGGVLQPLRSLLRFDVPKIPDVIVTNAIVRLFVNPMTLHYWESTSSLQLLLGRVMDEHAGWQEGEKNESLASPGELTWNWLKNSQNLWEGNCVPPSIGPVVGTTVLCRDGNWKDGDFVDIPLNSPEALSLVQRWCSGGSNEGLWLLGNENPDDQRTLAVYFYSSEADDQKLTPRLIIQTREKYKYASVDASEDSFVLNSGNWSNCSWGKWRTPLLAVGLNYATSPYRALVRFPLKNILPNHAKVERAEVVFTIVSRERSERALLMSDCIYLQIQMRSG